MRYHIAFLFLLLGVGSAGAVSPRLSAERGADIVTASSGRIVSLIYRGDTIGKFEVSERPVIDIKESREGGMTQIITLTTGKDAHFKGLVKGGDESMAVETRGKAQKRFPMVRTSHGASRNLRNNAVYSRSGDWLLSFPEGVRIEPKKQGSDASEVYQLAASGNGIEIKFEPLYYKEHKGLEFFDPRSYKVRDESVSGWCSWWAYFRGVTQQSVDSIVEIWKKAGLKDYGYNYIQLDDGYQGQFDAGRDFGPKKPPYIGGRPTTWIDWKTDKFPQGMEGYVNSVRSGGFKPAVWMGCFFTDVETTRRHPEWFLKDSTGTPVMSPWVGYVMDSTNPEAADSLIRPAFKAFAEAGMEYVKIDQLRHMIYDGLNNHPQWSPYSGARSPEVVRRYLEIAREELGDSAFILACWGVRPEAVGIADGCRIGGDGYGPVTMQQYNSWNGIVWRNDPDHCDILPKKRGVDTGNVSKLEKLESDRRQSIIRPALASIAGVALMLSDKPEVYADPANLVGVKRSGPVLFSVSGQIYDYDPVKTDELRITDTGSLRGGKDQVKFDGDQFGEVAEWWMNEFDKDFDHWQVLHRLNWTDHKTSATDKGEQRVEFADLGLDPDKRYGVFEFWSGKRICTDNSGFIAPALEAGGIQSFAIRELTGLPQFLSSSRHISQGAVEIEDLTWSRHTLSGECRLIEGDPYELRILVPAGYAPESGEKVDADGILRLQIIPDHTGIYKWEIKFSKKGSEDQKK